MEGFCIVVHFVNKEKLTNIYFSEIYHKNTITMDILKAEIERKRKLREEKNLAVSIHCQSYKVN